MTIFWKKFLVPACMWMALGPIAAQQISVSATLDSNLLLIGAQTDLKVEVLMLPSISVQLPNFLDTITRSVEVLASSSIDSSSTDEGLVKLMQLHTITSFDSGQHVIPPLPISVRGDNNQMDTIYSEPLALNILLVPVDTSQAIKPIKGPENIPYTLRDALPMILVSILVLLGLLALYYFLNRPKKTSEVVRQKPKEPPHIIAVRELEQLKADRLWQSGKVKEHHAVLSQIIRRYIEGRFRIAAMEYTNDEILGAFTLTGQEREIPFEDLRHILYLADLVKFAKSQPKPADNERSIEKALEFVNKTKKKTQETVDKGA